ncbi:MAG TPA: hypothetical protein VHC22_30610 [Pirellulales bacterium]|nr:hypothetical protein [Pirellulales bacterium]
MRKSVMLTLAFVACGLTVSFAARDEADAEPHREYGSAAAKAHPAEAKAVLAAANGYWDARMATQVTGGPNFKDAEELHLWSSRLFAAERVLAETEEGEQAAALGHWKRMEQLYHKVKALFDTGTKGGETEKLAAAKYYRAEAELWLVEAGGRVPEDRLE